MNVKRGSLRERKRSPRFLRFKRIRRFERVFLILKFRRIE
jgi:hypothetical protein